MEVNTTMMPTPRGMWFVMTVSRAEGFVCCDSGTATWIAILRGFSKQSTRPGGKAHPTRLAALATLPLRGRDKRARHVPVASGIPHHCRHRVDGGDALSAAAVRLSLRRRAGL